MKTTLLTIATTFACFSLSAEEPKRAAIGDPLPELTLHTDKNAAFSLRDAVKQKPAVLIFYRGGWCPYCTKHLSALGGIQKDLTDAGFQLIAISTDQPAKLREKPENAALGYVLLSDSEMTAAKALGISFKVDNATLNKYKGFGIDLEAASGQTHHLLPHPAVFIVDQKGIIRFAHINEDFKVRLEPEKVLEAARSVKP